MNPKYEIVLKSPVSFRDCGFYRFKDINYISFKDNFIEFVDNSVCWLIPNENISAIIKDL